MSDAPTLDAPALVRRLEQLGAWLQVKAGEPRVRIPAAYMTAALLDELGPALREHREAVIDHFRAKAEAAGPEPTSEETDWLCDVCGAQWGVPRAEAAHLAASPHVCGRPGAREVRNRAGAVVVPAAPRCPLMGRGEG